MEDYDMHAKIIRPIIEAGHLDRILIAISNACVYGKVWDEKSQIVADEDLNEFYNRLDFLIKFVREKDL